MSLYEMLEKERREARQAGWQEGRQEEREACIHRLIKATGCSREKAEEILGGDNGDTSTVTTKQDMQRMRLGG